MKLPLKFLFDKFSDYPLLAISELNFNLFLGWHFSFHPWVVTDLLEVETEVGLFTEHSFDKVSQFWSKVSFLDVLGLNVIAPEVFGLFL